MTFCLSDSFGLKTFKDGEEASKAGQTYKKEEFTGLKIVEMVRVVGGTVSGYDTFDIVMVDEKGNKYVTMVTGRLLRLASSIGGESKPAH